MISILILTRNEEDDIGACLGSCRPCDDVWVFDSESTDRTREIAETMGAHVVTRRFDDYAQQRNAALDGLPFKHPWVFVLDADERMNPTLWAEANAAVAAAPLGLNAFRVPRIDHLFGEPLRHAPIMSVYTRLLRLGHARYTRSINEVLEVNGGLGDLHTGFEHYSFSKGLERWFSKHNQYSTMEARICAEQSFLADANWKTALFDRDFHTRRRAQKAIFYQLPMRPLIRWLYILVVRKGILDGSAGISYATLQAFYEFQIVMKTREMVMLRTRGREGSAAAK